ncbi:FGGY-family carbohydrate kinase [Alkalihalobacillus oceani]|uniref:xylulokinase n=1 Tax=Halalkalibacter oceani TaxID=1653776 RepID=UPI00203C9E67|nr:FGGY-family carbohydrate kinase [Halalkalibacter oceani]MCM3759901.1 FGGY-family carbohydrate kinase [Halalkalibacter oceani]
MKKSGILALDVGTSSIRASIYIKDEGVKHTLAVKQQLKERFDIHKLWEAILTLMQEVTQATKNVSIDAIGVSAFLGWVIVKKNGEPVEKAWSWMAYGDQNELKKARRSENNINEIIGRELNEQLGVFYWANTVKTANEEVIVLSIKDFINFKLTNTFMMDRSHASYTGLYSIGDGNWDNDLLQMFNLPLSVVPNLGYGSDIVGKINKVIQSRLHLAGDTKVILGGPDGTLAILGSGGVNPGCSIEVMGTTDVIFRVVDSINTKAVVKSGLVQNSHILPGLFCIGGPTGMTGGSLEWLMKNHNWGYEHAEFIKMCSSWEEIKSAESGLFSISSLTGARVPDWNPETRGTLVGINPSHQFKEVFKATLEGIAFNTRRIMDRMESLVGTVSSITAIGGGAKNRTFIKTRAAIADCTFRIPKEIEASSFGVFALASINIGWYRTIEDAVVNLNPVEFTVEPDREEVNKYQPFVEKYNKLIEIMDVWYK